MPAPIEWLNEVQTSTGLASNEGHSDPQIIGLSNGNFLVAWVETGTSGVGTSVGNDIIGKIFDAEGNLVADSFQINTSLFVDDEDDFSISPTNDGGFIMVFVDDDIASVDQTSIEWARYSASGAQIDSAQIAFENVAADSLGNPQVSVNLLDNSSYVSFTDNVGADNNIRGVTVSATGTVSAEFDFAQNSSDDDFNGDLAVLTGGRVVSVYLENDAGVNGVELYITDAAGGLVTNLTVTANAASDPHVAALSNGNWVVTWVENSDLFYRVYTPAGSAVTAALPLGVVASTLNEPEVIGLPQGGFAIVWDDDTNGRLLARAFTNDGFTDGGVAIIETTATTNPSIGVTADGRLLFTWNDEATDDIFHSIWDPRGNTIEATDFDNSLPNFVDNSGPVTGNDAANTIFASGAAGEEILAGAGNDIIVQIGGLDNDITNGGFGVDTADYSAVNFISAVTVDLGLGSIVFNASSETLISIENYIGGGSETIIGSSAVNILIGGAGNNIIRGEFGVDTINGGGGDDTIVFEQGAFIDNVDGGLGTDTLDASDIAVSGALVIDMLAQTVDGFGGTLSFISVENVISTLLNDTITGSNVANNLNGNAGNDSIDGGSGNDIVNGGTGNDTLFGGTGDDVVNGGDNNDVIQGGLSTDTVDGGAGDDLIQILAGQFIDNVQGGTGIDTLDLSTIITAGQEVNINLASGTFSGMGGATTIAGIEVVNGTQLADTIVGSTSGDIISGNAGNDSLVGGNGDDVLNGGENNDTIEGGSGVDSLNGENGDDLIRGGFDIDTVFGGAGNDTIAILDGQFIDHVDGGTGTDLLDMSAVIDVAQFISISMANASLTGFGGTTNLVSIENVSATAGDDTILGNSFVNVFTGNGGDDFLRGFGGADTLNGGDGADYLEGGAGDVDALNGGLGNDIFVVADTLDILTDTGGIDEVRAAVSFTLGAGFENLRLQGAAVSGTGNALDNLILGGATANILDGAGGNDNVQGQSNNDSLFGGTGNDFLFGGQGNDTASGGDDNDTLRGDEGSDTLNGDAGDDLLQGGLGIDTLNGGAGVDILRGEEQNDTLNGNAGADTLQGGDGNDSITGGVDRDVMTGGLGTDNFFWDDGDFAGVTNGTADRITDFVQGSDRIRLNLVDAIAGGADNAFTFIGTGAFTGTAGELRYTQAGGVTLILGDTNGDSIGDVAIALTGTINLVAGDFVL